MTGSTTGGTGDEPVEGASGAACKVAADWPDC